MYKYLLLLNLVYCWSISAVAIIFQHDIPIEKYEEFAQDKRFEAVGRLTFSRAGSKGICTATLIDPYTLLTAAHCLAGLRRDPEGLGLASYSFKCGHPHCKELKISGARVPNSRQGHATFFGHLSTKNDLAVVFLARPIHFLEPAQLTTQIPTHMMVLAFAGYGVLVNGKTGEQISTKQKHAGQVELNIDIDTDISGTFYPRNDVPLNASPSKGDSGGAMMVEDATGSSIIAVQVGSGSIFEDDSHWLEEREDAGQEIPAGHYVHAWFAQPIYTHIDFLRDAMPYRVVITSGNSDNWMNPEAWQLLGSKDAFREEVNNHMRHDDYGMHKRHFKAIVADEMNLDSLKTVTRLKLRGAGRLNLGEQASLSANIASIRGGTVHFTVGEAMCGHINVNKLQFVGGAIHVTFDFAQPVQRASNDAIDFKIPTRIIGSALAGSTTESLYAADHQERLQESSKKVYKCQLFSSRSDIAGKAAHHFFNLPSGYDVQLIQESKAIYVQLTPLNSK